MISKAPQTPIFENRYAFAKFTQSFTYSTVFTYSETLNSNTAPLEIYHLNFSKIREFMDRWSPNFTPNPVLQYFP